MELAQCEEINEKVVPDDLQLLHGGGESILTRSCLLYKSLQILTDLSFKKVILLQLILLSFLLYRMGTFCT